jgi:regulator of cell morphogenesis and NO signaling
VGRIAAEHPATVRVFQRLGLDFCCGGKLPLEDACRKKGLSLEQTLEALIQEAQRTPVAPPTEQSLTALIHHIVETHHAFTRQELARLSPLVDKVARVHGENHGYLVELARLFHALDEDLQPHLLKEEQILFPYVLTLEQPAQPDAPCFGSVENPIAMMTYEHEAAGDLLAKMRAATSDYALPEDACGSFRALYHGLEALEADLHQHIHLENNVLFPRAVEMEKAGR